MNSRSKIGRVLLVGALVLAGAACGSDSDEPAAGSAAQSTDAAITPAPTDAAAPAATDAAAPVDTDAAAPAAEGADITLAINPWTGSAVNANVAKVVLGTLGTKVDFVEIDEYATWPGMEDGSIDAVLEVWPSGHADDYTTYVTNNKTVVDLGELGPTAKIGWYVPTFVVQEHPELATWEGFKDPALAKLFATAESGDLGQFLMGDPSYVTFDEQIIANLGLPLKYVVGGSEAAVLAALDTAEADKTPVLVQFWKPHWKHLEADLTEVKLPDVTDACAASAAAADGGYACDYPTDVLKKAASANLETKNKTAFDFFSKFQLTNDQQSEIAGYIDRDGMDAGAAAEKWVADNPDVVAAWVG